MTVDSVRRWLLDRGVGLEEVDAAAAAGQLHVLVADLMILPEQPRYTIAEVADLTGLPTAQVRRLWCRLGVYRGLAAARLLGAVHRGIRLLQQLVGSGLETAVACSGAERPQVPQGRRPGQTHG